MRLSNRLWRAIHKYLGGDELRATLDAGQIWVGKRHYWRPLALTDAQMRVVDRFLACPPNAYVAAIWAHEQRTNPHLWAWRCAG